MPNCNTTTLLISAEELVRSKQVFISDVDGVVICNKDGIETNAAVQAVDGKEPPQVVSSPLHLGADELPTPDETQGSPIQSQAEQTTQIIEILYVTDDKKVDKVAVSTPFKIFRFFKLFSRIHLALLSVILFERKSDLFVENSCQNKRYFLTFLKIFSPLLLLSLFIFPRYIYMMFLSKFMYIFLHIMFNTKTIIFKVDTYGMPEDSNETPSVEPQQSVAHELEDIFADDALTNSAHRNKQMKQPNCTRPVKVAKKRSASVGPSSVSASSSSAQDIYASDNMSSRIETVSLLTAPKKRRVDANEGLHTR